MSIVKVITRLSAPLLPGPAYDRPSIVSPLPTVIPEFTIAKPPLQNHNVEILLDPKRFQAESLVDVKKEKRNCATLRSCIRRKSS